MNTNTVSSTPRRSGILRPALTLTLVFAVVTGIVFPAVIWGLGQTVFPHQANGSLIKDSEGKVVGSELLGQNFARPEYFHPRPSAAGAGYDGANSSGTNLGPTSDKLINGIDDDPETTDVDESYAGINDLADAYRKENGVPAETKLPADAVTRSASGLDPHISPGNAHLQAERVADARGMTLDQVNSMIQQHTEARFAGVYGEPRVNVLKLNLALDNAKKANP